MTKKYASSEVAVERRGDAVLGSVKQLRGESRSHKAQGKGAYAKASAGGCHGQAGRRLGGRTVAARVYGVFRTRSKKLTGSLSQDGEGGQKENRYLH